MRVTETPAGGSEGCLGGKDGFLGHRNGGEGGKWREEDRAFHGVGGGERRRR